MSELPPSPTPSTTTAAAVATTKENSSNSASPKTQPTTRTSVPSSPMQPSHSRTPSRTKGLVDISRLLSQPKNTVDIASSAINTGEQHQVSSKNSEQQQTKGNSSIRQNEPIDNVLKLNKPTLPKPREPSKCPLFCCFYAEFDIIKGPVIAYESPRSFMKQDIGISTKQIHDILQKTFDTIRPSTPPPTKKDNVPADNDTEIGDINNDAVADDGTLKTKSTSKVSLKSKEISSSSYLSDHRGKNIAPTTTTATSSLNNKDVTCSTAANEDDGGSSTALLSIFDSTSEYIITGNELAGKMICLSTHHMHILTRPTVIANERYERNALLFCVGFVIRRTEDPRPFRPLLSKWAVTLRSMEVESQFLTKPILRQQLQPLLDRLLVSLNSTRSECNLLLNSANVLNLKLFRPPKPLAPPVLDYTVPILLRKDWQIQAYDWDLAINWVVMHIDGVSNARMISEKSEVDMEMVRACLRVLKHHGVIDLVDMFFYTNIYECTEKAAAMLAGQEPKLLQEAFDYVVKHRHLETQTSPSLDTSSHGPGSGLAGSQHQHSPRGGSSPVRSFSPTPMINATSFPPTKANSYTGSFKNFQEPNMSAMYRREQKKMKAALAELYCAFNRTRSFGDLWIAMTSKSTSKDCVSFNNSSATKQEDIGPVGDGRSSQHFSRSLESSQQDWAHTYRKRSASIENESSSPQREKQTTHREKKELLHSIDWKEVFMYFDHRRLATFGVVHGLLCRVHNFPFAFDDSNDVLTTADGGGQQPELVGGHSQHKTRFVVDFLATPGKASTQPRKRCVSSQEDLRGLISAMDGTKCDDELVCKFRSPIETLLNLVKTVGKTGVVSVYSTTATALN